MDQDVVRQLPYDVDIEQALLGAILIDNYALERDPAVRRFLQRRQAALLH